MKLAHLIAAAGLVSGGCAIGTAAASSPQLVYICQQQPCTNSQELQVTDPHGAPIFSVGEYGGAGVFGDNLSVYGPGSVYAPSVVESWRSPVRAGASCSRPAVWIAPGGIWSCKAGTWVRMVKL